MKERKIFRIAGLLLFLLAFAVEGMMFFRVQGSAPEPVETVGQVRIRMTGGEQDLAPEAVEPGAEIRPQAAVFVEEGSQAAYLRIRIEAEGVSGQRINKLPKHLDLRDGWDYNQQDGYYYFRDPVTAGENIPVFERIRIPEEWEKAAGIRITVRAEAVETSYLTPNLGADCKMRGWIPTDMLLMKNYGIKFQK